MADTTLNCTDAHTGASGALATVAWASLIFLVRSVVRPHIHPPTLGRMPVVVTRPIRAT